MEVNAVVRKEIENALSKLDSATTISDKLVHILVKYSSSDDSLIPKHIMMSSPSFELIKHDWLVGKCELQPEDDWQKYRLFKHLIISQKVKQALQLQTEISQKVKSPTSRKWMEILTQICLIQLQQDDNNNVISFEIATKMKIQYLEVGMMFDDFKVAGFDTSFQEQVIKIRFLTYSIIALILAISNNPKYTWISNVNVYNSCCLYE